MSYRPTRYIRTALESGATVETVTDGASYGLKLTSAEGAETRCRLSAEAVAAISSGFNALALGKGEQIKYEWRVVREIEKLEREEPKPTPPERAMALEEAGRPDTTEVLRQVRNSAIEDCAAIADMHDHRGDIGKAIRALALSASPTEVVEGEG